MSFKNGWGGFLARAALVSVLALTAGVALGHFAWTAATILRLNPGSGRSSGPLGFSGPGTEVSASGVPVSILRKVDPALVDINTELGLEAGQAAGTGMVVTSTGEVITNNHVINGATKITATDIGTGRTYAAHVVGYDRSQDIAVLQLEGASGLRTVSFATSGTPEVGQGIATIGNARGLGGTPSSGVGRVTALDQSILAGDTLEGGKEHLSGLIQIQGDLEPGDSGGPLVNGAGEVLGMDTAASSSFEFNSAAGVGFAIPIDHVQTIAHAILAGEGSSKVHIGLTGMFGVFVNSQDRGGAFIESVIPGSSAASTNIRPGDTITAIDGTSITSPTALTELILEKHPGDTIEVTWQLPYGGQETATAKLGGGPPQ